MTVNMTTKVQHDHQSAALFGFTDKAGQGSTVLRGDDTQIPHAVSRDD